MGVAATTIHWAVSFIIELKFFTPYYLPMSAGSQTGWFPQAFQKPVISSNQSLKEVSGFSQAERVGRNSSIRLTACPKVTSRGHSRGRHSFSISSVDPGPK